MLRTLPRDRVAVFMDEVDMHTNPKIGSMWMRRGEQAEVVTPGNNEKRYLAGSLDWRTGRLILTEGRPRQGRNTELFLAHMDDLRWTYRRYRVIHVIRDNAKPHSARRVPGHARRAGGGGALPAGLRPPDEPARAGVVAPARGGHPEPPVPGHDRVAGAGAGLAAATCSWACTRFVMRRYTLTSMRFSMFLCVSTGRQALDGGRGRFDGTPAGQVAE